MEVNEFERIAVARDLVRKPEVKLLANILFRIGGTTSIATEADEIPAFYIILAHRIMTRKAERELLLEAIKMFS